MRHALWLLVTVPLAAQDGFPAADRIRVAEAFRLAERIQDSVWPGWSVAPFELLLVTGDRELLFRAGGPPSGWTPAEPVAGLPAPVWQRARVFSPTFLATFPAFGG